MNSDFIVRSALAGLIAVSSAAGAIAAEDKSVASKEKCYGIAKAGKNSCANAVHACAGYSKVDNSLEEWIYTASGSCLKVGGKLAAPPEMPKT